MKTVQVLPGPHNQWSRPRRAALLLPQLPRTAGDRLVDLARVAAATATDFIRSTLDEPELSVGIVLFIQTHGSLLNWQPHVHALVTDGGFRPDGSFVHLPLHRTEVLTEAFRRAVLSLFVRHELFAPETSDAMLAWHHSGFSVHDGVCLDHDDRPAHERLARYCARRPLALDRLDYDAVAGTVTYRSDKASGPTAGVHDFDPLDFIDRLLAHIPDKGQVLQRYYGYYSNRARGERRKEAEGEAEPEPVAPAIVEPDFSRRAARRRWAELLRRVYEVDPLVCPRCGGEMRIIAFIQTPRVIDRILRHLREKGRDARAGPWVNGSGSGRGALEAGER